MSGIDTGPESLIAMELVRLRARTAAQELALAVGDVQSQVREVVKTPGGLMVAVLMWKASDPPPTNNLESEGGLNKRYYSPMKLKVLKVAVGLIEGKGRRVPGPEIDAEIDRRGLRIGESTVRQALCAFVNDNVLVNPGDRQGYGIGPELRREWIED